MIKFDKRESKLYYYDAKAGESPVRFIEAFCCHGAGELKGKPIELMEFQKNQLRNLFGVKKLSNNKRRYKKAYIQLPKKNAKTTLMAGVMVYLQYVMPQQDRIFFAAAAKHQASIAFDITKYMVTTNPRLKKISKTFRDSIHNLKNDCIMKVISSDAATQDGIIPSAAIIDEIHRHKSRDLYDVISKGVINKDEPLIINITTAGAGQEGIGWDMYLKAKSVKQGITIDDTLYVDIWEADPKDDPFSIETLKKCNPGFGVIVKEDALIELANEARNNPSEFAAYQRFHLNMWTASHSAWLEDHFIQACNTTDINHEELKGKLCYTGTDLASNRDLSSTALFFPSEDGKHKVIMKYWCPTAQIGMRSSDNIDYSAWQREGHITACGNNAQDHDFIFEEMLKFHELYDIQLSGFDRNKSIGVIPKLDGLGLDYEPIAQGVSGLSEPMKYLEKLILDGDIEFGGDPVLRWQFNNVMVKMDANENIYPNKEKSKDKIDGIVALIMAIAVWQLDGSPLRKKNLYNDRGIISI